MTYNIFILPVYSVRSAQYVTKAAPDIFYWHTHCWYESDNMYVGNDWGPIIVAVAWLRLTMVGKRDDESLNS